MEAGEDQPVINFVVRRHRRFDNIDFPAQFPPATMPAKAANLGQRTVLVAL
jgi:hypothetical protein